MSRRRLRLMSAVLGVLGAVAHPIAVADQELVAASTAACQRVMHCMSENLADLPEEQRAMFMQALEGTCDSFRVQGLDVAEQLSASERGLYLACTNSLIEASCQALDMSGAETPECERFGAAMEQRGS